MAFSLGVKNGPGPLPPWPTLFGITMLTTLVDAFPAVQTFARKRKLFQP